MRVTTDAVQVMGGYGYMRDHPVERMMSDEKMVKLPMDAPTACWLKHCVTAWLAERSLRLL